MLTFFYRYWWIVTKSYWTISMKDGCFEVLASLQTSVRLLIRNPKSYLGVI